MYSGREHAPRGEPHEGDRGGARNTLQPQRQMCWGTVWEQPHPGKVKWIPSAEMNMCVFPWQQSMLTAVRTWN